MLIAHLLESAIKDKDTVFVGVNRLFRGISKSTKRTPAKMTMQIDDEIAGMLMPFSGKRIAIMVIITNDAYEKAIKENSV